MYDWIPFFGEIAERLEQIHNSSDPDLQETASRLFGKGDSILYWTVDPLSVMYKIASQYSLNKLAKFKEVLKIEAHVPQDRIFPTPSAMALLYFHNKGDFSPVDASDLWTFMDLALRAPKSSEFGDLFGKVLKIGNVGVAKLTQVLFLINPREFLPIDQHTANLVRQETDTSLAKKITTGTYMAYREIMKGIQSTFPGAEYYELSRFAYAMNAENLKVDFDAQWYQISSQRDGDGNDYIDEWFENSYIELGYIEKTFFERLKNVPRGSIIVARFGMSTMHGIGITLDDNFLSQPDEWPTQREVIWLVKDKQRHITGFSRNAICQIQNDLVYTQINEAYPKFWKFIEEAGGNQTDSPSEEPDMNNQSEASHTHHSKNLILYGPPGTGKTWLTRLGALRIIDGGRRWSANSSNEENEEQKVRYKELVDQQKIAMVTFHQSYGYEEFVEGIRPALNGPEGGDLRYSIHTGIFKEMCERAGKSASGAGGDEPAENYVLIIDEINRGNVSRIFGELITLIEEDKRAGGDNPLTVRLPYSGERFSVPSNLYIIGTMNTADKSLVALDTALRRRFDFAWIPSNPDKLKELKIDGIGIADVLRKMNAKMRKHLDMDHEIGHAYFWPLFRQDSVDTLDRIFRNRIIPQLQEYFYDNADAITEILNASGIPNGDLRKIIGERFASEYYGNGNRSESESESESDGA